MSEFTIAEIGEHVGRELGVSGWVIIDQSRIDNFAHCTGDHQWIHVDNMLFAVPQDLRGYVSGRLH